MSFSMSGEASPGGPGAAGVGAEMAVGMTMAQQMMNQPGGVMSQGPAASGIPEFDELMDKAQSQAPSRSLVSIDDVGRATAFLALDGAKLITGSVLYIDGGYHIID